MNFKQGIFILEELHAIVWDLIVGKTNNKHNNKKSMYTVYKGALNYKMKKYCNFRMN